MKKISVIIPCFNQGEFIMDAILSVEQCDKALYELIIVNDGSTEAYTIELLAALSAKGYCIINQSNQGLAMARNNGIAAAKGPYILALDADNKIRPNYINRGIEILDKNPDVAVVHGYAQCFGEKSGVWKTADFNLLKMLIGNYIDACAVFRKSVWELCGGYDPHMPLMGFEDWDFWLTIASKDWKFFNLHEISFDYRVRSKSMVKHCFLPENYSKLMEYIYAKHYLLIQNEMRRLDTSLQKPAAHFLRRLMAFSRSWFKK